MLNIDYVMYILRNIKPLDVQRVSNCHSAFYVAITNATSGESRVVDVKRDGIPLLTLLNATMAIVPLFNYAVEIDGEGYVDGGVANPIPICAAVDGGCSHILVLLTKPEDFIASKFSWCHRLWLSPLLAKWSPAFTERFFERQESRYNASRDVAMGRQRLSQPVHIAVICPGPDAPTLGRATISKPRLMAAIEYAACSTKKAFATLLSGS